MMMMKSLFAYHPLSPWSFLRDFPRVTQTDVCVSCHGKDLTVFAFEGSESRRRIQSRGRHIKRERGSDVAVVPNE
eukprot:1190773-Prorocentrum_minimum.AAC.3